jgi:hypothetical protein
VAQRTQIVYTDDFDGSEADGTIRFGVDGTEYEIDLNKEHTEQLTKVLGPFIAAARKVSGPRRSARGKRAGRHNQPDVRARARAQGITVSDRGRIPADVLDKYRGAH